SLFCLFQHRSTVRTSGCLDGNLAHTERTGLGGGSLWLFLLLAQAHQVVDTLEQAKQYEGHDQEIHQRGNKGGTETGDILQIISSRIGYKVQNRVDKVVGQ